MPTKFKRVLNFAINDFYRNKGLSVAAIFILTITVLLITTLFFVQTTSRFLISTIQDKIDITAYFKEDSTEFDILNAKDEILKISEEVKSVEYVSKEDALEEFSQKYKDSEVFSKALLEVGDNPFLPSLNIRTTGNLTLYEQISDVLGSEEYSKIVDKVDFLQKKDTIEKLFSVTSNINKFGLILSIILIFIAVSIVFNTIKLVIDSSKEEISTMRIVGASSWFIRAPFVLEGAIFGSIAFGISLVVTALVTFLISPVLSAVIPGFNIFNSFLSNFWIIILIQIACGAGLGAFFSFLAVRKYLKI